MPLPSSGPITINQIRTELGSGAYSLRTLSAAAGKSIPDAMSEFYGFSMSQGFLGFSSSGPRSLTCNIGTQNLSIGTLTATSQNCSTPSQVSIFNQPNSNTATLVFIFGSGSFSEEYEGPVRVYNIATGALVFSDFIDVDISAAGSQFNMTLTGLAGGVSFYYEILINGKSCPPFPDPNIL